MKNVLQLLRLSDIPDSWYETWNKSMSTFPGNDIWFLKDEYLIEANKILNLNDGAIKALMDTAAVIMADVSLCKFAWHLHSLIYYTAEHINPWKFYFPSLGEYMGNNAELFGAIVLISGLCNAVNYHIKRGIPLDITLDTFSDVGLLMDHYHKKYAKWGLEQNKWLIFHFTGRLYRLGRLQYIMQNFSSNIIAFHNISNGKSIALSEAGIRYKQDGQVDGTNGLFDTEGSWVSQLDANEIYIRGNIISPYGYAVREPVDLAKDEWIRVLSKGDPVLDIHIPEDGRMDYELCGESLNTARKFFAKYFSEKPFFAYICDTWFFDSQYQKLLSPTSNIVKFQREFYLYPVLGSDYNAFIRVFGEIPSDFSKAPRDTQLRRAILNYIASGGRLHNAGGFILKDDLNWGREVYQKK